MSAITATHFEVYSDSAADPAMALVPCPSEPVDEREWGTYAQMAAERTDEDREFERFIRSRGKRRFAYDD